MMASTVTAMQVATKNINPFMKEDAFLSDANMPRLNKAKNKHKVTFNSFNSLFKIVRETFALNTRPNPTMPIKKLMYVAGSKSGLDMSKLLEFKIQQALPKTIPKAIHRWPHMT